MIEKIKFGFIVLASIVITASCSKDSKLSILKSGKVSSNNIGSTSTATGIAYNQKGG
ncbi:MAG: hypothetical protein RI995_580, partial [Bacteroidota bacterium]